MTGEIGIVYLVCFQRPLAHARHYKGWCKVGGLDRRMSEHLRGKSGASIMEAVAKAGIGFDLVVTWDGTRDDERRLKAHGAVRHCPRCTQNPRPAEWMTGRKVRI
jgi:hypothetical protein